MAISFGEIAGLIAASAFLLLVIFLAIPIIKLAKTFESTAKSIEELTEDTKAILKGTSETIDATNVQIEKIDSITSSVAKTVQNIAALSDLYSTALGKPVVSAISSINGIKNVVKDTSKKIFDKVDGSLDTNEKAISFKKRLLELRKSVDDIKLKTNKVSRATESLKKASNIENSVKDESFSVYHYSDKNEDLGKLSDVEKSIVGNVSSFEDIEKDITKIPGSTPAFDSSLKTYEEAIKLSKEEKKNLKKDLGAENKEDKKENSKEKNEEERKEKDSSEGRKEDSKE